MLLYAWGGHLFVTSFAWKYLFLCLGTPEEDYAWVAALLNALWGCCIKIKDQLVESKACSTCPHGRSVHVHSILCTWWVVGVHVYSLPCTWWVVVRSKVNLENQGSTQFVLAYCFTTIPVECPHAFPSNSPLYLMSCCILDMRSKVNLERQSSTRLVFTYCYWTIPIECPHAFPSDSPLYLMSCCNSKFGVKGHLHFFLLSIVRADP